MDSRMLHHTSQTFLIAADTSPYLLGMIFYNLLRPVRISDQLPAHGGAVDAAGRELLFYKIRGS